MCLCSPVRLSLPCSCLQHHSGWLIKAALIDRALKPLYSALFCSFLCDNPCISQSRLQVNTTVSRTSKLRKLRLNGFFSPRGQTETQNCTTTPGLMCFTSPLFFVVLSRMKWKGGWGLDAPQSRPSAACLCLQLQANSLRLCYPAFCLLFFISWLDFTVRTRSSIVCSSRKVQCFFATAEDTICVVTHGLSHFRDKMAPFVGLNPSALKYSCGSYIFRFQKAKSSQKLC